MNPFFFVVFFFLISQRPGSQAGLPSATARCGELSSVWCDRTSHQRLFPALRRQGPSSPHLHHNTHTHTAPTEAYARSASSRSAHTHDTSADDHTAAFFLIFIFFTKYAVTILVQPDIIFLSTRLKEAASVSNGDGDRRNVIRPPQTAFSCILHAAKL